MSFINGHKKVLAGAAGLAAMCSVLSFLGGTYNGWTQRVEASVVVQRMVNEHDETLQKVVPKVETCHEVNALQQSRLEYIERDMSKMAKTVEQFGDLMQLYLQSQMREGKIPR